MEKNLKVWGGFAIVALFLLRNQVKSAMIDSVDALNHPNVKAFLAMIKKFESNGEYNILYGGGHFSKFDKHPNIRVPFFNPKTGKNDFSTAAGAYQINHPTYLTLQALPNIPSDFSARSQDLMAVALLKMRGALGFVVAGDFGRAVLAASGTWASLPYSDSGQNKQGYNTALNTYTNNGGSLA
jgi:muramidase (phage lysozyme)